MEEMNYASETLRCLAGFEQVWARVNRGIPPQNEPTGLEPLLWKLFCLRRMYAVLSGQENGPMRRFHLQTDGQFRRLQAEYFITGGMHWHSGERFAMPKGRPDMLRKVLLLEEELSAGFRNAAGHCAEPALQTLWERYSEESAQRHKTVRKALIACF